MPSQGDNQIADIKKFRRKRRRRGSVAWAFMAVFLLACSLGGYFFALSPFFMLEHIRVEGNQEADAEKLIQLSGLEPGMNIFAVNSSRVAHYLQIDPHIQKAKVSKSYPSTIVLKVEERSPVVILPTGQGFVYVAADGVVVYRRRNVSTLHLPILVGVSGFAPGIVPGSRIEGPELEAGLKIMAQFPEEALADLAELDVADTQKILLYTAGGLEVRLGDAEDFEVKYTLMRTILEELSKSGKLDSAAYIDISIPEKPVIYY